MNEQPIISVIVPVYNTEKYLEKCVESILNQTYKKLEIILIDDGSTDNCGKICDQYAKKDKRVVVVHQKNTGQASARNHALSIAQGEYIGFVDSDDWITSDMYEVMLGSLVNNNADIVVCGRFTVRDENVKKSTGFNLEKEMVFDRKTAIARFLTYKAIDSASCDKLFKRQVLAGVRYPEGKYICEDFSFIYKAISSAEKIVHCAKPLYYVTLRSGSTSRSVFSQQSMGLYYRSKEVFEAAISEFPQKRKEAEFFYFKNLIILALKIASSRGEIQERKKVNGIIRRNAFKILANTYLRNDYKLLTLSIVFHIEKICVRIGKKLKLFVV